MSSNAVGCSLFYEKMCAVPRSSSSLGTSFPWQLSAGENSHISSIPELHLFVCNSFTLG
jgi:hypothetical protein